MFWIIEYFFFLFGLNVLFRVLVEVVTTAIILTSNKKISEYGKGSWALVTACTDGIGLGFATLLAKEGFNIVQVGRNPEKLVKAATDLKSKYGIEVKNVVKDFGQSSTHPIEFFQDIYNQTEGLDISIIVNNVGYVAKMTKFGDMSIDDVIYHLSLNVYPITFISRLYLPDLIKRNKGGAVFNLGSIAGLRRTPQAVMYSSTKSFDYVLSEALSSEMKIAKSNVDVICIAPGMVDTPLGRNFKGKFLLIDIFQCAQASLKAVGSVSYTPGHWKHLIAYYVVLIVFPIMNLLGIKRKY